MGFALLGLVLLQINWISQDIDLRRQKFDDKVQEALINAAGELETGESLSIISKSFQHDFTDSVESVFQHHEWKSSNDSVLMELTTISEEVSDLDEISVHIPKGKHGVVVMDRAGWHRQHAPPGLRQRHGARERAGLPVDAG